LWAIFSSGMPSSRIDLACCEKTTATGGPASAICPSSRSSGGRMRRATGRGEALDRVVEHVGHEREDRPPVAGRAVPAAGLGHRVAALEEPVVHGGDDGCRASLWAPGAGAGRGRGRAEADCVVRHGRARWPVVAMSRGARTVRSQQATRAGSRRVEEVDAAHVDAGVEGVADAPFGVVVVWRLPCSRPPPPPAALDTPQSAPAGRRTPHGSSSHGRWSLALIGPGRRRGNAGPRNRALREPEKGERVSRRRSRRRSAAHAGGSSSS